ncbi:hypothetical protein EJ06DRAFT_530308 [Trichodelitschia bisporula]|uniref:Homeobox domain-containing protein n=1 Tax=Trichodelitschia bisporula TaxID=703511 RepID=A0A6G1HWD8_9PEZI|nr:hypothetical protein EJ06DRAFT_530308 [Trichodelitschia bisporula]
MEHQQADMADYFDFTGAAEELSAQDLSAAGFSAADFPAVDFSAAGFSAEDFSAGDFTAEMLDAFPLEAPLSGEVPSISPVSDQSMESYPDEGVHTEFGIAQEDFDYTNFAKWIPRYKKPHHGCTYCKEKHLECWFTYEGQTSCSPCSALFRHCSFNLQEARSTAHMEALHTVQEDQCIQNGTLTNLVALKSYDRTALEPQAEEDDDDDERPSRKTGTRFSRAAVKILKDWMEQHRENPYPTDTEKEHLKVLTGLKLIQINNWLANTRRRHKLRTPRGVSPSIRSPTWPTGASRPVSIPTIPADKRSINHHGKTWDIMNPLERWQHSPPENEPASVSDIANALKSRISPGSSTPSSQGNGPSSHSAGSAHRAPSIASLETGQSDSLLSSGSLSHASSKSYGSKNSFGSYGSGHKDRRRRRRTAANPSRTAPVTQERLFQCTFCTDTFRTKFDWTRHEKSLHLSLEKWICAPLGPVITSKTGQRQCVYCLELNPTDDHLETHGHSLCEEKGMDARTFYRKDHLRQHLRLVHGCKMLESMDAWKSEAAYINSRCGFCDAHFTNWQERCDHLAKHFRSGMKMSGWKGCRGLDSAVAAQVTNAMPPYLIGHESKSPIPFSASNANTWLCGRGIAPSLEAACGTDGVSVNDPQMARYFDYSYDLPESGITRSGATTCWAILTVGLGQYVREQLRIAQETGVQVQLTDEHLQDQARRIMYDSDDTWNQTAADNPEWLELFKKAHGLPNVAKDIRVDLDEDLGANVDELNFDMFFLDPGWDVDVAAGFGVPVQGF